MATNDYAITNTLLQSLFGPSPEQQAQAYQQARDQQALQMAQLTPGRGAVFAGSQLAQDLGQSAQQLGGAVRRGVFGIETPKEIEDNVANQIKAKAQPLLQQGDMAAYADFLAQEYSKAGLTDRALRARTAADQFKSQADERKASATLKQAQTIKALADAEKASREGKKSLAEQLVELQTKEATEGLTAEEAAKKEALERVVKLQSPKGTNVDLKGIADVLSKESAKAEGKAIGEANANITGKQQAVDSITEAMKYLDKGIYSGQYAEVLKKTAKSTMGVVGDKERVVNTETFLAEINNTVIPMLKEFGGNDSNEELRFLQRVVGGDITLEEKSIRNILTSAKKKINRGIERLRVQNQAIRKGESPMEAVSPKPTGQTRTTKSGVTYIVEEE